MTSDEQARPPRDLIDFYRRWSEFKPLVTALSRRPDLDRAERETMKWLILLVDRIAERDIDE